MAHPIILDVAKYVGIGVGTVSRVLNNHPFISDPAHQEMLDPIAEPDYTPNSSARCLSLRTTLSIAAIVPFITRPAQFEQLYGVKYALANGKYDLVLFKMETPPDVTTTFTPCRAANGWMAYC
jgi:DNA-binding LacI/PurR family transcriptional regulator